MTSENFIYVNMIATNTNTDKKKTNFGDKICTFTAGVKFFHLIVLACNCI